MNLLRASQPDPGLQPASGALRVLLIVEPATATMLAAAPEPSIHQLSVERGGVAALSSTMPALRRADMVVVEVDPARQESLALFEIFAREQSDKIPVIAAVRDLKVATTRLVLRAGAVDVLALPFTADELASTVEQARGQLRAAPAKAAAVRGKIVSFVGAIGGCGTTALVAQAGIMWAATARVCLIDLDVQFGNAALYLDLACELGIADVLEAGPRLDVELLRTIAQTHASGLSVIASPQEIVSLDTVLPEHIDRMLSLAAQAFDIVLVDLPGAWTAWSMRVVEVADLTVLVTSLTVPGIHQARRQSEIITANGFSDRLRVVVNRVVHPMFGKVDLAETQSLLGRRIDYTVANDYPTVSAAIDRGKPLAAIKSRSRVEKDVRSMVAGLAATLQSEPKL